MCESKEIAASATVTAVSRQSYKDGSAACTKVQVMSVNVTYNIKEGRLI